mmetsp:Transcript_26968/g.63190  ORF Transcript_26968/g.63190 Transcript_26968/m.63190 type:complete len:142 (+) Transcript_26968:139-564(+)
MTSDKQHNSRGEESPSFGTAALNPHLYPKWLFCYCDWLRSAHLLPITQDSFCEPSSLFMSASKIGIAKKVEHLLLLLRLVLFLVICCVVTTVVRVNNRAGSICRTRRAARTGLGMEGLTQGDDFDVTIARIIVSSGILLLY